MLNDKFHILMIGLFLCLLGCKQDNVFPPDTDGSVPDPVSDVVVENIPGGAILTYQLPESGSPRYVEAKFPVGDDMREVKVSSYNNVLRVEGFPDTSNYTGQLYTVSQGEKRSEPVSVTIKPQTPPIIETFRTISMEETFGGVRVNFQNQSEADLVFDVITQDSVGELVSAYKYYTQSQSGTFAARGFDAEPRNFGIYVRDRWQNRSDTIYFDLTPLFEEELNKDNFQEINLPTDTYEQHCCGEGIHSIWDGVWNVRNSNFHTKASSMPQWFTFDLGVTVQLSRFKFFHRNVPGINRGAYYSGDVKEFEVWGSNDPNPDGSWESWTKIGDFESIKPSGQEPPTNEDMQYCCADGEDFEIPDADMTPAIRYIRIKVNETWGGDEFFYINELTFWGRIQEENVKATTNKSRF